LETHQNKRHLSYCSRSRQPLRQRQRHPLTVPRIRFQHDRYAKKALRQVKKPYGGSPKSFTS